MPVVWCPKNGLENAVFETPRSDTPDL